MGRAESEEVDRDQDCRLAGADLANPLPPRDHSSCSKHGTTELSLLGFTSDEIAADERRRDDRSSRKCHVRNSRSSIPFRPMKRAGDRSSSSPSSLDALVFDFDGLILDTEIPIFRAWQQVYADHGVPPIDLDEWASVLGLHHGHPDAPRPLERLARLVGGELDLVAIEARRREIRDDLIGVSDLRPGVIQLLDEAQRLGVPTAIASSSSSEWILSHLEPRGLLDRFDALSCAGDGVPGKPDPATYLQACHLLGADPVASIAFEDSPNGVLAAKAAGLYCVAVPNGVSARLDFPAADRVVGSLLEVDLRSP